MIKHFALLIGVLCYMSSFAQYDITVKLDGLSCDDELLLANHFGNKQYLKDTSECIDGLFHFKGKEKLKSGVYLIVLPSKNYIEVLVSADEDQTKYYFETDTTLKPDVTLTRGSIDNKMFLEFNKYAVVQSKKGSALRKEYEAEENEKKKEKLKEELRALSKEVAAKRSQIATENADRFVGRLYSAMEEITAPDAPEGMSEDDVRTFEYLWLRDHYWDKVDMSENGLVLSPVFHNKIKAYFDNYMPPIADTAIMMADTLINRIERGGSSEQYKYAIHFLLGHFEKAKYMCFDKAVWHMAKNYYCAGKAFWSDSAYTAKMCEESAKMELTLCDQVAPDMSMPDTSFTRRIVMSQIDKPVTVLVFWDINCGHCKKEMPIISQIYDSMTNKNFEIYAVYTQGDWEGWKKRLAKDKFNFINVANAFGEDKFRKKYNIRTTPQIYVLDKDKNIRFKKIGAKDIPNIVQHLLEEQGVVPKKEKEEKK
ncbi:MAG: thioredoxin-like domain-containing protein [Bacteroidia bacterium]